MSQRISETVRQSERIRVDLIGTELDLGFTFARIAFQATEDAAKRARNIRNARVAYDTICRLIAKASLSDVELGDVQRRTRELKSELVALGEAFS